MEATATNSRIKSLHPLNMQLLFWLFVVASIAGLAIETAFHAVVFGGYESRPGLVWGPFSPIYGTGAVMLTIVAARFSDLSTPAMFLVSALIGSAVELATGWLMEILFGAVAWDYSHLPGSFGRSLNPGFTLLWGALGLAWTHCAMPLIYRISQRVDWKSTAVRILSAVGTAFMAFNIAVTLQVLARESARADDLPPANSIERCIDERFPSSWVQKRFENMSINGLRSR